MVNNALFTSLNREYERAKLTLVKRISKQDTRKDVVGLLQSALALATERQSHHCIRYLHRSFRAGFILEYKSVKATIKARKPKIKVSSAATVPEGIVFDYSKVSKTHLNKITRNAIGAIGWFNKGISKQLIAKYDVLVANNVLVNNIAKHGFTENAGAILLKQGISPEMIGVIKSQSTTNKMISILEQQGIRGVLPPNQVAKLLVPVIQAMFGTGGVTINNIGKIRKVLRVNASGEFWWEKVKIKNAYKTTVKNYSSMIAITSIKRAHNEGRLATMRQSGLVGKYRFISAQTGNTCLTCLGMHGLIVHPTDVSPPIHIKCYCTLTPVYKDPDLNLHGNDYYIKQRDAGLWRKHQFDEYNKGLVPADRIPNPNFLPPEMLKGLPSGKAMEAIRASLLK